MLGGVEIEVKRGLNSLLFYHMTQDIKSRVDISIYNNFNVRQSEKNSTNTLKARCSVLFLIKEYQTCHLPINSLLQF